MSAFPQLASAFLGGGGGYGGATGASFGDQSGKFMGGTVNNNTFIGQTNAAEILNALNAPQANGGPIVSSFFEDGKNGSFSIDGRSKSKNVMTFVVMGVVVFAGILLLKNK